MGNRHNEREIGFINPSEYPYRDIELISDMSGERRYDYVPALSGMTVRVGYGELFIGGRPNSGVSSFKHFIPHLELEVPLLPPIAKIPPPQFDGAVLVSLKLDNIFREVMDAFCTDTNVITLNHGVSWNLYPETYLKGLLISEGVKVGNCFPIVGGRRKRVQTHALILGETAIKLEPNNNNGFLNFISQIFTRRH